MNLRIVFLFFTLWAGQLVAQQNKDILNYVAKYKHVAIEEMVRTGIPASITLAQGILESGCGKSALSVNANNHFGIKCKTEWAGQRYYQDDDEANECFRVYEHAEVSYIDHSDFLLTRFRYANLFQHSPDDYKAWAHGLKAVGYATNPNYANLLINYIENYSLHQYDRVALELIEENNKLLGLSQRPMPVAETKQIIKETVPVEEKPAITTGNGIREYTINGVRAIRAKGNEDPLAIALEYQINYSSIMVYNDLATADRFKEGTNIFLQPKKQKGEDATYIALPGETMHEVSQKLGIKLKDLYALNLMKPNDQPYPGEALHLREKRTTAPRSMSYADFLQVQQKMAKRAEQIYTEASVSTETLTTVSSYKPEQISRPAIQYEVQKADTLYSIAQKFNTSVDAIKKANNLDSNLLKPGQILVVSN